MYQCITVCLLFRSKIMGNAISGSCTPRSKHSTPRGETLQETTAARVVRIIFGGTQRSMPRQRQIPDHQECTDRSTSLDPIDRKLEVISEEDANCTSPPNSPDVSHQEPTSLVNCSKFTKMSQIYLNEKHCPWPGDYVHNTRNVLTNICAYIAFPSVKYHVHSFTTLNLINI